MKFLEKCILTCFVVFLFSCGDEDDKNGLATILTNDASSITSTTAVSGGNVTSEGTSSVTARGVCWSTSQSPTTNDNKTTDGSGIGSFTSSLSGLSAGTSYYVRAYATNGSGTSYGAQVNFTTISGTLPIVTTNSVSQISVNTATSGGNVSSEGTSSVTARGVCWSTSQSPTITDNKTTDGSGIGTFTSSLSGLSSNSLYYIRAYATNSDGTSYGSQLSFTTSSGGPLSVTTDPVIGVLYTSAISGGNVISDGSFTVTARGVCWSTTNNPTTLNSHSSNGTGPGLFVSYITGLSPGLTYFVRSYVTYSGGTLYGSEVNFTTKPEGITVTDIDGNVYHTVTIGTQVWMVENLKTTKFNNGTAIGSNHFCAYDYNSSNISTYGYLYDGYVASNSIIAPSGWRVPTDNDWKILEMYLGLTQQQADSFGIRGSDEGNKLKEVGNYHWASPSSGTNINGFTALPGGSFSVDEVGWRTFSSKTSSGIWWSSTENGSDIAWYRYLGHSSTKIQRSYINKKYGFSIRCIKN